MHPRKVLLFVIGLFAMTVADASAATLWRGTAVVSARTLTSACMAEYAIGEALDLSYRPNLGRAVNETVEVVGSNGSLLITSTDTDRTLRTGSISITGSAFAKTYSASNVGNPVLIAPTSIISTTPLISMSGTLYNAGLSGCSITFRAYLLPVFDGDFPNASNTGVPPGVQLKPSGSVEVKTAGAVISGLDITGSLYIDAPNVIVRRVRVNAQSWAGIVVTPKGSGVLIEDSEIFSTWTGGNTKAILFDETSRGTVVRSNMHSVEDGLYIAGDYFVIQDNYIHHSRGIGADPHTDGVQIAAGSSNIVVKRNTVAYDDDDSAAFTVGNNHGAVDNLLLEENLFTGGGYTVRCDGRGSYPVTRVSILNNRIAKGAFGHTALDGLCKPVFKDNTDLASGAMLEPK